VKLWTGGRGVLNQHLFKVSSPDFPKWFYYLWTVKHLERFQRIAADKATTMGHIKRSHLSEAKALVPPGKLLRGMSEIVDPLIERRVRNDLEARSLVATRDTLLPELLSGELRTGLTFSEQVL
jgi:type I restriction enzyme S subunit